MRTIPRSRKRPRRAPLAACALSMMIVGAVLQAEDWPEWRGKGRIGVWNETGLVEKFPPAGLTATWRTPINSGYAGPAVSGGRVFVTDARPTTANRAIERAIALDEATGKILWTREWPADYTGMQLVYAIGPRATPTVDDDRVYVAGASGNLLALDVKTGAILWEKNYLNDFNASIPSWGSASAPLVDGDRLICIIGGEPDGKVIALNKLYRRRDLAIALVQYRARLQPADYR